MSDRSGVKVAQTYLCERTVKFRKDRVKTVKFFDEEASIKEAKAEHDRKNRNFCL